MTKPGSAAGLDDRFAIVWEHARGLENRIDALETWRATTEAVSAWRRWVLPVTLSAAGFALTVLNVFVLRHH